MHPDLKAAPSLAFLTLADLDRDGLLSPNAKRYADYWRGLPKVDLVPERRSFDPTELREILPHFGLLEIVEPMLIRFRLMGSGAVQRYGVDVTGQNYLDYVAEERREAAAAAFHAMAQRPCGMLVIVHATTQSGRHTVNEALGFPFRNTDGQVTLLYFQSNSAPTKQYYDSRLDILDTRTRVSRRLFIDIGAGVPTDFHE